MDLYKIRNSNGDQGSGVHSTAENKFGPTPSTDSLTTLFWRNFKADSKVRLLPLVSVPQLTQDSGFAIEHESAFTSMIRLYGTAGSSNGTTCLMEHDPSHPINTKQFKAVARTCLESRKPNVTKDGKKSLTTIVRIMKTLNQTTNTITRNANFIYALERGLVCHWSGTNKDAMNILLFLLFILQAS